MGAVRTIIKLIFDDGIMAVCPARGIIANLTMDLNRLKEDPIAYHPAAAYCKTVRKQLDSAPYKDALPHLAQYLSSTGKLPTLLASPAMRIAISTGTTASWKALCDSLATTGATDDPKETKKKIADAGVKVHTVFYIRLFHRCEDNFQMALLPFSVLGLSALSVAEPGDTAETLLVKVLGDINNGLEKLGWTHLSDRGLSEAEFIQIHPVWYKPKDAALTIRAGATAKGAFATNQALFTLDAGTPIAMQIAADFPAVLKGLMAREPLCDEALLTELAYGACFIRAYLVKTGCVDREFEVVETDPPDDAVIRAALWARDRKPPATAAVGLLIHHCKLKHASNHAVGGSMLPVAVLTAYARAVGMPEQTFKGAPKKVRKAATSAVYMSVHAFSTLGALMLAHNSTLRADAEMRVIGPLTLTIHHLGSLTATCSHTPSPSLSPLITATVSPQRH